MPAHPSAHPSLLLMSCGGARTGHSLPYLALRARAGAMDAAFGRGDALNIFFTRDAQPQFQCLRSIHLFLPARIHGRQTPLIPPQAGVGWKPASARLSLRRQGRRRQATHTTWKSPPSLALLHPIHPRLPHAGRADPTPGAPGARPRMHGHGDGPDGMGASPHHRIPLAGLWGRMP